MFTGKLCLSFPGKGNEHCLKSFRRLPKSQGWYAEAEPKYLRSLAIRESVRGPDHPDVATSLNNLASLLHRQVRVYPW